MWNKAQWFKIHGVYPCIWPLLWKSLFSHEAAENECIQENFILKSSVPLPVLSLVVDQWCWATTPVRHQCHVCSTINFLSCLQLLAKVIVKIPIQTDCRHDVVWGNVMPYICCAKLKLLKTVFWIRTEQLHLKLSHHWSCWAFVWWWWYYFFQSIKSFLLHIIKAFFVVISYPVYEIKRKSNFRKWTEIFLLSHIKSLIPDIFKATHFLHWLVVVEYLFGFCFSIWEIFYQKNFILF